MSNFDLLSQILDELKGLRADLAETRATGRHLSAINLEEDVIQLRDELRSHREQVQSSRQFASTRPDGGAKATSAQAPAPHLAPPQETEG